MQKSVSDPLKQQKSVTMLHLADLLLDLFDSYAERDGQNGCTQCGMQM